jgi:diguanylate cyclase (GGDEF)-like protein
MQQREAHKVLSIAIVDIDHFKSINDRSGHLAGDDVLREVAKVLHAHCGARHEVCRLGGDEFILLLPDLDAAAALNLCDRARLAMVESNVGRAHQVTLSIGIAELLPDDNHTAFLTRADNNLFVAKREGRNRVAK